MSLTNFLWSDPEHLPRATLTQNDEPSLGWAYNRLRRKDGGRLCHTGEQMSQSNPGWSGGVIYVRDWRQLKTTVEAKLEAEGSYGPFSLELNAAFKRDFEQKFASIYFVAWVIGRVGNRAIVDPCWTDEAIERFAEDVDTFLFDYGDQFVASVTYGASAMLRVEVQVESETLAQHLSGQVVGEYAEIGKATANFLSELKSAYAAGRAQTYFYVSGVNDLPPFANVQLEPDNIDINLNSISEFFDTLPSKALTEGTIVARELKGFGSARDAPDGATGVLIDDIPRKRIDDFREAVSYRRAVARRAMAIAVWNQHIPAGELDDFVTRCDKIDDDLDALERKVTETANADDVPLTLPKLPTPSERWRLEVPKAPRFEMPYRYEFYDTIGLTEFERGNTVRIMALTRGQIWENRLLFAEVYLVDEDGIERLIGSSERGSDARHVQEWDSGWVDQIVATTTRDVAYRVKGGGRGNGGDNLGGMIHRIFS